MFLVPPAERMRLAPLFVNYLRWRPMIDSILEGGFGIAETDSLGNPRLAQLTLGYFTFFGGKPELDFDNEFARNAVRPPFEGRWVGFTDEAWKPRLLEIHGEAKFKAGLSRYDFSADKLDINGLLKIAQNSPPGFRIVPMDEKLAASAAKEIELGLIHSYESAADFAERGFGICAIDDSSGRIACGATTYARSLKGVEIEIDTHKDFRRKGLAASVGASIIAECLELGLDPHWDAMGKESAGLATKLGYRPLGEYEGCWLDVLGY